MLFPPSFSGCIPIVTIGSPQEHILKEPTEEIKKEELPLAKEIAQKLHVALSPFFPAAGLAAPQIGISRSVFIFSVDRDPKNLEPVVNPTFTPIGDTKIKGWEGCFSVILSEHTWKLANIPRYEEIDVQYMDLEGQRVEKRLKGFAAKVFQHECDHLQGITNICRNDAEVKEFKKKEDLEDFLRKIKETEASQYK